MFTVTRDFVRDCQTPILVLPDDVPAHPYAVALESAHLAPNAQVSIYPWKANPEQIQLALRHVRAFLKAHRPVSRCASAYGSCGAIRRIPNDGAAGTSSAVLSLLAGIERSPDQADPAAASGISFAHRIVSRSGRISAIPMTPPTSMMTPQIIKPVLKPSSGVAAVSTTLPMT